MDNAWAQIDVQLKRRADLIPNLMETVKGYMVHERETLEAVTKARSAIMTAKTPQESMDADTILTGALKSLFAVAESYPDLKANQNFLQLQDELTHTEDKISYSRQHFNDSVLQFGRRYHPIILTRIIQDSSAAIADPLLQQAGRLAPQTFDVLHSRPQVLRAPRAGLKFPASY